MVDVVVSKAVNSAAPDMQSLMTEIARALVDEPEAVQVEAIQEGESTLLRLRVAPNDIGKVIGKQGRTARSLRTILGAASMKLQHRFGLDIVESDHERHGGE
jgi:predicted RNA-binding protein YlqC (UPF0109 family)